MRQPPNNRPRGLGELLQADSPLGDLARAASHRLVLTDTVRQLLPPALAAGIAGCNLRADGTLWITATSPVWAARLRFEGDGILSGCRTHWPATARVRFRTSTGLPEADEDQTPTNKPE